nr:transposase [Streptomyces sp. SID12501]
MCSDLAPTPCPARPGCSDVYGRSGRSSDQFIPGWPYSFVAALETGRTLWCQLLDAVRLGPDDDVAEVTARQVRRVVNDLIGQGQWEDGDPDILVVFDAGYDAPRMAYLLHGLPVEVLGRTRADRVMRRPTPSLKEYALCYPQGGRPPKHGKEFRFARPDTWGEPGAETVQVTDRYGTAQAMAWARIHPRLTTRSAWIDHDGELPIIEGTLIRLQVDHLPGGGDPLPVWPWSSKTGMTSEDVDLRWQGFLRRFDLEHTFRFVKQTLGWTRPRLRSPEAADRWTWLVIAAHTQLRHTREAAADLRRPWEKRAEPARLTPARVRRGFRNLRPHLHSPARAPKPSTPVRGSLLGSKNRRPATRYDVGKSTRRPESIAERNHLKAHKP